MDVFPNGGDNSKKYIIETTGSGVAFIDYDNDGLLDIFVVSGHGGTNRLYHNDGKGHFPDVTERNRADEHGWSQGVCAGDYDNDGFTDLFVTPGAEPSSIAMSAASASKTSPTRRISRRIACATTPAAPFSITTTTAAWTCSSPIT